MTFEGKAKVSYIELIALYVHPKNSNHQWSHSRAIMALDHFWLVLENKSGWAFCVRQVYFTQSCQLICRCVNQPFILFIHHTSGETVLWGTLFIIQTLDRMQYFQFFKTNCTQSIFRMINRGLLTKPFKKFPKSPIRPAGSHFWQAPSLQCELWRVFEGTSIELRFNIKNYVYFFIKWFYNDA